MAEPWAVNWADVTVEDSVGLQVDVRAVPKECGKAYH